MKQFYMIESLSVEEITSVTGGGRFWEWLLWIERSPPEDTDDIEP